MTEKTIHQGRNVKRLREMLGIKQESLAIDLGDDWNQKKISQLENKEEIDPVLLEQIARSLKVPVEAIKNFDEEKAIVNIQNNYEGAHSQANVGTQYNFNPIEKWIQALDENKSLYERLLKAEQEKVVLLERLLKEKE